MRLRLRERLGLRWGAAKCVHFNALKLQVFAAEVLETCVSRKWSDFVRILYGFLAENGFIRKAGIKESENR